MSTTPKSKRSMLLIKLTLDLYFNHSITSKALSGIANTPFKVVDVNTEEHYISIEHPTDIGIEYEMESYYQWYVDFMDNNYSVLKKNGLEYANIFINVFYKGQCNFEIFDKESLATLSKYDISYPISIFALSDKELLDILNDYGVSSEKVCKLFQTESSR